MSSDGIIALGTYHFGGLESAPETPIMKIFINITFDNAHRLRIRITDNSTARWEVPYDLATYTITGSLGLYNVSISQQPMGIQVVRNADNKVIFNLDPNIFFSYDDQDILFTNNLGYPINVLGLGERITSFIIPTGTYTLWSSDKASPIDDGQSMTGNMYSSHPFYMVIDESGKAFGSLFYNSNAMSATVNPTSITMRSTGGIIDVWIFIGPEPEDVIFQYHSLINPPVQIPYSSLGWHQCRYGYKNVSVLSQVLDNYTANGLPLDYLWSDIDYMSTYEDFVLDPVNYPRTNMTVLISKLQSLNKGWIPIVDAGTAQNLSDPYYNKGTSMNVWIMDPYNTNQPAVGIVWPGNATFVDWVHPNASDYWSYCLSSFENTIAFSGIWLDMNEASNFNNGNVGHAPTLINSTTMPWTPGDDLNTRSLDVASIHYNIYPNAPKSNLEYNMHSLYGYLESKATSQWYINNRNRPFIISRSSFPGSGQWASKWLGDNYAQWSFMEHSITGIFTFGMFGIPMIGADICGFLGNTNLELCARWTQLGTMYPFSRNHNDINSISQEPWALGPLLLETNQFSIRNKYMLYLYFYSRMMELSMHGGMFFKPAFWAYPNQMSLLYNATSSFMLGNALIVHPCLWHGIKGSTSFFPDDIWYDLYSGEYKFLDYDNSLYLQMDWPGLVNIHLTTGHIIPTIDNYKTATSSFDTRRSNISLIITQSGTADANGKVIFDDGLTWGTLSNAQYTDIEYDFFSYNSTFDIFSVQELADGYTKAPGEWPYISTLIFYGCTAAPESVYLFSQNNFKQLAVSIYWNAADMICKIWLKDNLAPDQPATLYIDYLI
jgi:alpha-glucosidase (family GH31 glycosyl hydrolase)